MEYKNKPFLTEDFVPDGGGIDFLGLRQVNLHILETFLLPGINNQTSDPGIYCIGAWILWKFKKLCEDNSERYTYLNFKKFKEAIEIIMSHSMREDTGASKKFGEANNKIGKNQKLQLPQPLEYKLAKRTDATSIYAAPLYGPSLRYLELLQPGEALSIDGKSSGILLPNDDSATEDLCHRLDLSITKSPYSSKLFQLKNTTFTEKEIDDLGESGIHPGFFRKMPKDYKKKFTIKLLPEDAKFSGHYRTLTCQLLVEVVKANDNLSRTEVRDVLLTRKNLEGINLIVQPVLNSHLINWSLFMLRQYQRYSLEMFRYGFEKSVAKGLNRIDKIAKDVSEDPYWKNVSSFRAVLEKELNSTGKNGDLEIFIKKWTNDDYPRHPNFIRLIKDDKELSSSPMIKAFKILVRWWGYLFDFLDKHEHSDLLKIGGADRIGQSFLYNWIKDNLDIPLSEFLTDFLSLFVFNQHLRVSLSRFDGIIQRMRYVLDDNGIVPSSSVGKDFGKNNVPWMADRLDCFITLLVELDILAEADDGGLQCKFQI